MFSAVQVIVFLVGAFSSVGFGFLVGIYSRFVFKQTFDQYLDTKLAKASVELRQMDEDFQKKCSESILAAQREILSLYQTAEKNLASAKTTHFN